MDKKQQAVEGTTQTTPKQAKKTTPKTATAENNKKQQILNNPPIKKINKQQGSLSNLYSGNSATFDEEDSPFLWNFGRNGSSTRGRCGGTELRNSVVCCTNINSIQLCLFKDSVSFMFEL